MKFSRLTRRGVLLGLSAAQLVVVGIGAVTLVFALYFGGGPSLVFVSPVLAAVRGARVGGRRRPQAHRVAPDRRPLAVAIDRRAASVPSPDREASPGRDAGLPGDAARLRQWLDPESGAVMVHDPHRATLTAIVGVTHPAFILLDPIEQQRRVAGWGRVLATACRSGRIASLQVMERTLPDSGKGLAEWWSAARHVATTSWTSSTYARTHRPRRSRRRTPRKHRVDLPRHEGCRAERSAPPAAATEEPLRCSDRRWRR